MSKKKPVDFEDKDVYAGELDENIECPEFDEFFDGDAVVRDDYNFFDDSGFGGQW